MKRPVVAVIVQCRLASSRLPRKALLPLGGKPLLEWTLSAMRRVKADDYILAVDSSSAEELAPIAERNSWRLFAGPADDVLERFCRAIRFSGCNKAVRATADNPFLFYEAAQSLLDETADNIARGVIDYATYTALPHGSGVEVFGSARCFMPLLSQPRLTTANTWAPRSITTGTFSTASLEKASAEWAGSEYRTTVDTEDDYKRSRRPVRLLSGGRESAQGECFGERDILRALGSPPVERPALLVPLVRKGGGTGHLRRGCALALAIPADVYVERLPRGAHLGAIVERYRAREDWGARIVRSPDEARGYRTVVFDFFATDSRLIELFPKSALKISLDDGGPPSAAVDYLINTLSESGRAGSVNYFSRALIGRPERLRSARCANIKSALVTLGGEDPAGLSGKAPLALLGAGLSVTVVATAPAPHGAGGGRRGKVALPPEVRVVPPREGLRDELYKYDLVVTHFGFTAYEATSAGCAVICLGTTARHVKLARENGFKCLTKARINEKAVKALLEDAPSLYPSRPSGKEEDLGKLIDTLSRGKKRPCPVGCRGDASPRALWRTPSRTFARCPVCGYVSYQTGGESVSYDRSYFFEDYKRQYGATYLEDFEAIKRASSRRVAVISSLEKSPLLHGGERGAPQGKGGGRSVLDIGCAMGPFLVAAREAAGLTKPGGIFAFATPCADGASARFNPAAFYTQSPRDHISLWGLASAKKILRRCTLRQGAGFARPLSGARRGESAFARSLSWARCGESAFARSLSGARCDRGQTSRGL